MYHLSRLPATGTFQFLDGSRLDREAGDGANKLLWAATLLAMLARRVFQEFGIGVRELRRGSSAHSEARCGPQREPSTA